MGPPTMWPSYERRKGIIIVENGARIDPVNGYQIKRAVIEEMGDDEVP